MRIAKAAGLPERVNSGLMSGVLVKKFGRKKSTDSVDSSVRYWPSSSLVLRHG